MTREQIQPGKVYLGHDGVCRKVARKHGERVLVQRLSLPRHSPIWMTRERFSRQAAHEVSVPDLERLVGAGA
mgnify:CR=1 FL=1